MKKLSKNEWVAVGVSLVVIAVLVLFTTMFRIPEEAQVASVQDEVTTMPQENREAGTSTAANTPDSQAIAAGLKIEDVVVGTGAEAQSGRLVSVHYTGKFADGTVFDSSIPRGKPFEFPLGQGMVISGWEEGVKGMKVGGKRRLTIPPMMAYGPNDIKDPSGKVVIPGNSTLYFDVELIGVQ